MINLPLKNSRQKILKELYTSYRGLPVSLLAHTLDTDPKILVELLKEMEKEGLLELGCDNEAVRINWTISYFKWALEIYGYPIIFIGVVILTVFLSSHSSGVISSLTAATIVAITFLMRPLITIIKTYRNKNKK